MRRRLVVGGASKVAEVLNYGCAAPSDLGFFRYTPEFMSHTTNCCKLKDFYLLINIRLKTAYPH